MGKSTLLREFGSEFPRYIEFQGLAPVPGQTNGEQIKNFLTQLYRQTDAPKISVESWSDAFELLGSALGAQPTLVLLDEISWMGKHDRNFAGELKIFWDSYHRKFPTLVFCLCGSVSSWIEKNILNSTHFVGRISLILNLQPLKLQECNEFFGASKHQISAFEKLRFLAVTGGIPKYLEEFDFNESFDRNINRLAFASSGFLFGEFSRLFNNSFETEKEIYVKIINALSNSNVTLTEIAEKIGHSVGGTLTKHLTHLELAGFITKDPLWNLSGKPMKSPRYRLSDNYIRFYLRCIRPNVQKIESGIIDSVQMSDFPNWRSILGLQFENLVLANLASVFSKLEVSPRDINVFGPYFQAKTSKNRGGCQIDLLIQTKFDTLYLTEFKFSKQIGTEVIESVQRKIDVLERRKYHSIRPALVYAGEVSDELIAADYFHRLIDVGEILESSQL